MYNKYCINKNMYMNLKGGNIVNDKIKYLSIRSIDIKKKLLLDDINYDTNSKIAIIVPYRNNKFQNRDKQLEQFIEYYHNYIKNLTIYVIEQSEDGKKFNRGKLLNCGYEIAKKDTNYDMYIFHDVDLISPEELKKVYTYVSDIPIHIASLWKDKYKYPLFFGGIQSISSNTFKKINGYPNNFWGWGGEDDALYNRLIANNMSIYKLVSSNNNILIKELEHINTTSIPNMKNENKLFSLISDVNSWTYNGLSNIKFKVIEIVDTKYENCKKYILEI